MSELSPAAVDAHTSQEGTVCPISFVKDTLVCLYDHYLHALTPYQFPYALKALPEVVDNKWQDKGFAEYRDAFPAEHRTSPATFLEHVRDLTQRDVKIAYLKNLQGYLWEDGYRNGVYGTPLFEDVVPVLEKWRVEGRGVSVYSSGSVFAQKLLFQHVKDDNAEREGGTVPVRDLRGLVEMWFDTVNAGPKLEKGSYERIVGELGCQAGQVVFLSDNVKEIKAAEESGLRAVCVDRPGNAMISEEDKTTMEIVTTFEQVQLDH